MLKDYLKLSQKARRIFGKRELEIMTKQLDGMLLTQSERNRLSRDIKPKLEAIEGMAEFKNEFKLKKNQDNKRLIEKAVKIILNDKFANNIKAVLLFGSFADNSFTKSSDVDICVVFRTELSIKEATEFRIRISGQLPEKIDIQVFNILPQKVKREIAVNHNVLYKNNDYDNVGFSIRYLKDNDYFIRMHKIFGVDA